MALAERQSTISAEVFPASLLEAFERRLDAGGRCVVLDLGGASGETLQFLQRFPCRLVVSDAARALVELTDQAPEQAAAEVPGLIPDGGGESVDLVLAWDLLNYLSRPLLAALARRLTAVTRPGALVHALMDPAATLLPAEPPRFGISGATRISRRVSVPLGRPAQRHTPWDIERYGGNLVVERSVMLRNGLQEYLLRVAAEPGGPREVKPVYRT